MAWIDRSSGAILAYADDRAGSVAALNNLIAEMRSSLDAAG